MYSTAGALSDSGTTTWASHSLSYRVRGAEVMRVPGRSTKVRTSEKIAKSVESAATGEHPQPHVVGQRLAGGVARQIGQQCSGGIAHGGADIARSEERRVGKEGRSRWSP